jgi:hypothetical protein
MAESRIQASGISGVCARTIEQAVDDLKLMGKPTSWRRGNRDNTSFNARLRDFATALDFFRNPNSNFPWMCEACEIDPEVVREKLEPILEKAIQTGLEARVLDPRIPY